MIKKKKTKDCSYGVGSVYSDLTSQMTNVSSGALTLTALRKLWNSIENSSDAPTQYIDSTGIHEINNKKDDNNIRTS